MKEIKELERRLEDLKTLDPLVKKTSLEDFLVDIIKYDKEKKECWEASELLNSLKEIMESLDSIEINKGDYFSFNNDYIQIDKKGTLLAIRNDIVENYENLYDNGDGSKTLKEILESYDYTFYQANEDFIDLYKHSKKEGK